MRATKLIVVLTMALLSLPGLVWAATPDRNLRSASGMPSRSNVALICSGTSSQDFSSRSDGLR